MNKTQLFLIHFAGGNRYSFQFLQPYLPDMEFIPLELPGRGKRIHDPLLEDFEEAAADIFRQVKDRIRNDFILYGHSLGAVLALLVAAKLEQVGLPPSHLIVSGNAGPGVEEHKDRHLLERTAFKKELERLGGVPAEFLQNEELFDFYEPLLRADFHLAEKGQQHFFPVINTPIHAIMGTEEDAVEHIENWRSFTLSHLVSEILPGDHFFIHQHPGKLAEIIRNCCLNKQLQSK